MKLLFLALELACIFFVVVMQLRSFARTSKAMKRFADHAVSAFRNLSLKSVAYDEGNLDAEGELDRMIHCHQPSAFSSKYYDQVCEAIDEIKETSPAYSVDDVAVAVAGELDCDTDEMVALIPVIEAVRDNKDSIELINGAVLDSQEENDFRNIILSTNAYLVKNKGVASDFGILQDICERRLQAEDEKIAESLSTPLYLGLCGTFVGIIFGVMGMLAGGGITTGSDSILWGVAIAMTASLLGLGLTTWNKVKIYPETSAMLEDAKNDYFDFMQRELMPSLSLGVAGTLASFKDVLGNFISKFGNNISGYAETARLMNKNLENEHLVLQEINNLNITKASKTIAESFATLKESSDELKNFKEYQVQLNGTIQRATEVASRLEGIISTFSGFVSSLDKVANTTNETQELQKQFKESLETHFPTIKDHETVWREQLDEISKDTQKSSTELQEYLKSSSEYIKGFVADNQTFLSGLVDMRDAAAQVKSSTDSQTAQFAAYKASMDTLKQSIDRLYDIEAGNQNGIMAALKAMLEENTNPQYVQKLKDIQQALNELQSGRQEVLDAAKGTLEEIKGISRDQVAALNQEKGRSARLESDKAQLQRRIDTLEEKAENK